MTSGQAEGLSFRVVLQGERWGPFSRLLFYAFSRRELNEGYPDFDTLCVYTPLRRSALITR